MGRSTYITPFAADRDCIDWVKIRRLQSAGLVSVAQPPARNKKAFGFNIALEAFHASVAVSAAALHPNQFVQHDLSAMKPFQQKKKYTQHQHFFAKNTKEKPWSCHNLPAGHEKIYGLEKSRNEWLGRKRRERPLSWLAPNVRHNLSILVAKSQIVSDIDTMTKGEELSRV